MGKCRTVITEAIIKIFGSVKFVLRINGSFSKKVMGQFFSLRKTKRREGGYKGGLAKDQTFSEFFSEPLPLPRMVATEKREWYELSDH